MVPRLFPAGVNKCVSTADADTNVLMQDFGFDNTPSLDRLRQQGFRNFDESFANYPKTELAMATVLNMNYLGQTVRPEFRYRSALNDHLVGRLLKEHVYQYYHFGNLHNGLRSNKLADFNYQFFCIPTELAENLFKMPPLRRFPDRR